jgi:hypothetical protein
MSAGFTTQGFQDLLTFPFRAPGGKGKLLIGGLLGLAGFIIPILPGLFLLGYGGLMMRRIIIEHGEPYLPEWNDWSEMLTLGLRLGGASFVYSLPALFVFGIGYAGMMVPTFMIALTNPRNPTEMGRWLGMSMLGTFGGMAVMGVGLVLLIATVFLQPPALGHVIANNSFRAAFRIGEWWQILRANLGGFLVSIILLSGVYMGLVLAMQALYMTVILCVLIPFLMMFVSTYLLVIYCTLFAQAYAEGVAKLGTQSPPQLAPAGLPAA